MTSSRRPPGDSDVAFFAELRARLRQMHPSSRESMKGPLMPKPPAVRVVPPPPVPSPAEANRSAQYAAGGLAQTVSSLSDSILTGANGRAHVETFRSLARADLQSAAVAEEVVAELQAFATACARLARKLEVADLRARARCAQLAAEEAQEKAVRAAEALAQSMTTNRKDDAQ